MKRKPKPVPDRPVEPEIIDYGGMDHFGWFLACVLSAIIVCSILIYILILGLK